MTKPYNRTTQGVQWQPKDKPETILEKAAKIVEGQRQDDYGPPEDNFADIAKGWSVLAKTRITPKQVALMMGWLKIVRENNKPKEDNLVDLAGYSFCASKIQQLLDKDTVQ